ncbi:MAG: hypothetical protein HFI93_05050 [Lachnospiraceae bacterium]|nr:hypothetical protein [Lachnospiraceae bacterium]
MRIINATWEKRLIGMESVEFELSTVENLSEAKKQILSCSNKYQVVKVPVGDVKAQLMVQDCGFKFYETNYQLERKIKKPQKMPEIFSRFQKDVSFRDAAEDEIDFILKLVEGGTLFTTDKIAQDPYFSPLIAGRRYSLRARDMIEKGARTVLGLYKGNTASFTIYEDRGGYYLAFIGGMLNEYENRGMGFIPLYVTGEHVYRNGGGVIKTGVSSNNPSMLKLQLLFGVRITDIRNIYIKHIV